ncbi:Nif3-like dinuclear metal center hexameric protein [candidate division KSB1 bacterium]|nr:Nif3-like dinuclear metal center hexameric protein [candidate division KSB1 bacterium]
MKTSELIQYLDAYLEINKIPDASQNGLQVEGKVEVKKLGVAVDACQDSIAAAVAAGVDLLLVHHGLFWDKPVRLVGSEFRRVQALIANGINLYTAHLPLDWHPQVGNNAVLARKLGFEPATGFGASGAADGRCIGCIAEAQTSIALAPFLKLLASVLHADVRADLFGTHQIKRIAIVTGGGAFLLPHVLCAGVDAYITGEPKHSYFHFTKENKLNVIYGGHYETETFGVLALAEHLQQKFQLPFEFFHFPTGL